MTRFQAGSTAILAITAVFYLYYTEGWRFSEIKNIDKLRPLVAQELTEGDDVKTVMKFLTTSGIEEKSYSESDRTLYAIVRDIRPFFLIFGSTSVTLRFHFDEHDKLLDYEIEEVHTFL